MKRTLTLFTAVALLAVLVPGFSLATSPSNQPLQAQKIGPANSTGPFPYSPGAIMAGQRRVLFTQNAGQWPEAVTYRAAGAGAAVWFTREALYTAFYRQEPLRHARLVQDEPLPPAIGGSDHEGVQYLSVKTSFVGASPAVTFVPEGNVVSLSHYFRSNQPDKWQTNVPSYSSILIEDVYPGIAVRFYSIGPQMEYDFRVDPGADPSVIHLRYSGVQSLHVDEAGDLVVATDWGEIVQQRPVVFQKVGNIRVTIPAEFELHDGSSFGFKLNGDYHPGLPLIIDPVLSFCTYLGGGSSDAGYGVAVDDNGSMYIAGATASTDFPDTNAYQGTMAGGGWDAFVAKYSANGDTLLFCSYLGGSDADYCYSIAVDGSGSPYLVGRTNSTDFPTAGPIQSAGLASDAFVTKFSPDGSSLSYSTYLGGSGADYGWDITLDAANCSYITGYTLSADFPTVGPVQSDNAGGFDLFISKLNSTGSALHYSTYLGGAGTDIGQAVCVDTSGRAHVTGYTTSTDFPLADPFQDSLTTLQKPDLVVARLSADGSSLEYSSYLGGRKADFGSDVAVRDDGSMYLFGRTMSTDFPMVNALQGSLYGTSDLLITRLNAAGDSLVYSTYLGGSDDEYAGGIAVDSSGRVFVSAYTASTNFPNVSAFQTSYGGGESDVVVARLNADGDELDYSTFLGGSEADEAADVAVDGNSCAYVVGQTVSTDFPLKRALQGSLGGNADAFVAWITGDCIDTDEDGVCDSVDNCLSVYNPLQEDTDLDGVGDSCDVCPLDSADDIDQDGYCADEDNCPSIFNPGQEDPDTDGYGTPCDNCPTDFNPDQMDSDLDEQGDSCDICPFDMHDDYDGDGICGDVDNCPGVWNPDQLDADSNGIGDVCEGCCIGTVGNVDGSEEEEPDISDMQRLIDHLFVSMAPLGCLEEADIDRSGGTEPLPVDIDIADMQLMIDHLFINMEPFLSCP